MGDKLKNIALRPDERNPEKSKTQIVKRLKINDESVEGSSSVTNGKAIEPKKDGKLTESSASTKSKKGTTKLYDFKSISALDVTSTNKKKEDSDVTATNKKKEALDVPSTYKKKEILKGLLPEEREVTKGQTKPPPVIEISKAPTKKEIFELLETIKNELCDIRAQQVFTLQNLGMVKADVIRVKEAVNRTKWFTDALLDGVYNLEMDEDCLNSGGDPATLELFKNSIPREFVEDSIVYNAVALYDYKAADDDEISFDTEDIISEISMKS